MAAINNGNSLLRQSASSLTPSVLSTSPKIEACFEAAGGHLTTTVTPVLSTNSSSSSSNNNGYISQPTQQQQPQHHNHTNEQHHQHLHHHHHHHDHMQHQVIHQQHITDIMEPQLQQENLSYTQLYPVNESIVSSSSSLGHDLMHQYPDTTTGSGYYSNNNYYYDATVDVSAASLIRPFSANSNSCSSSSESDRQLSTGNASIVNGTSPQTTYSDLSHSFELNYFSDSSSHQHHHQHQHQQQQQHHQQHHLQHNTITELTSPLQGHHITQLDHQQQQQHHSLSTQLELQHQQHPTQPPPPQQQQQHIVANSFTETFKNVNAPHYTSVIVEPQHYINNEFVH